MLNLNETCSPICYLCAEARKQKENNLFHDTFGIDEQHKYILEETRHFVVIPSLGALVLGHLLVLPKAHIPSMSHLHENLRDELQGLVRTVKEKMANLFDNPVLEFEHGQAKFGEQLNSCVEHAHLHLIPSNSGCLLYELLQNYLELNKATDFRVLRKITKRGKPYIYFHFEDLSFGYGEAIGTPSQLIRRIISDSLGVPEQWNWIEFPQESRVEETIAKYRLVQTTSC